MVDFMSKFLGAAKTIVASAPKYNREQRDEIRRVVGELTDTLSGALHMAIIYLHNSRYARDQELN